ncbi:hypothetical protein H1R20_g4169, partial [Candolleomyces eurysporus]
MNHQYHADPFRNNDEHAQLQRRFPRAGYWLGMLPTHPDIEHLKHQLAHGGQPLYAPQPLAPPYARNQGYPPHGPPPGPPPPPYNYAPPLQNDQLVPPATQVTVTIPLNTGVVGGVVTRIPLRLPSDIEFLDFFDRVCAKMDLDPTKAQLGYRLAGEPVRNVYRLGTEEDLRTAMDKLLYKMKRARTKEHVMEIENMSPGRRASQVSLSNGRKRPAPTEDEPDLTISYRPQLQELKRRLECAHHKGKYCYISPLSIEHQQLDVYALTLWAKQILLNPEVVTYTRPPATKHFDHRPTRKRARKEQSVTNPEIHVHLNHIPFAASNSSSATYTSTQPRLASSSRQNSIASRPHEMIDLSQSDSDDSDAASIKLEPHDVKVKFEDKENWQF